MSMETGRHFVPQFVQSKRTANLSSLAALKRREIKTATLNLVVEPLLSNLEWTKRSVPPALTLSVCRHDVLDYHMHDWE
jgi:hypothetical protein